MKFFGFQPKAENCFHFKKVGQEKDGNILIIDLLVNIDVLGVRAADAVRKLGGKYNI